MRTIILAAGRCHEPSPRNYRHRTCHGTSASLGYGKFVTHHPSNSKHCVA
jgi:hypothetical protein